MKNEDKVVFLRQMLETQGWKVVQENLRTQITSMTEAILDSNDETMREEMRMTKRELLIKHLDFCKFMAELPENIIKSLDDSGSFQLPSELDDIHFTEKDFQKPFKRQKLKTS